MRVLTWQSYGNVRVMAADTPMHFMKIFERLKLELQGWGEEKALGELFEAMGRSKTPQICERHFMGFVSRHLRTHETFEVFEFNTVED